MAENATVAKVNNVKALREEINSLKTSLSQMSSSGEDCAKTTQELYKAEKELASAMAVRRGEQNASSTSIAGMEQELKALQGTLRSLSEEQKKSDWAKEMVKNAEELSEKLNHAKQDIGDFKNNIGHYAEGVEEAFGKMGMSASALTGPLKMASAVTKDFGGAMKALFANPWALLIAAIVMILKKLVDAFKNNKKAMEGLKKGMEPLKPIMNAFHNVLGLIGEALGKVVGWISDKLAKAFQWLLGVLPKVVNAVIDAINFISLPARKFWEFMLEGAEAVINLVGMLPGMGEKMKKTAEVINKVQDKLSQGFNHVSFDLTGLTADVEDNTEATEDNTEAVNKNANAQNKAAEAAKKRAEAIEELKKRLDEDEKDELQKLEEKYEAERELIKGNVEYEEKLRGQYLKERGAIEAKFEQQRFSQGIHLAERSAKYWQDGTEKSQRQYLEQIIKSYERAQKGWEGLNYQYTGSGEKISYSGDYENQDKALDTASRMLLGIPYSALQDPEGFIQLSDAFENWNDTLKGYRDKLVETIGNESFQKIDKGIANASKSLNIAIKSMKMDSEKGISDTDNEIGLSWWGVIGRDAVGEQLQSQRDFQDESFRYRQDYLNAVISAYQTELENFQGTEEQKRTLIEEMSNYRTELMEAELQHEIDINNRSVEDKKRAVDATKQAMSGLVNILGNVESAWKNSVDAQLNAGKISQEEADKQFEAMKGIQSASAMINALLSANEAYSSLASIPYVGPALGAAAAAAALAAGIANVVTINQQQKTGSSGGGGSVATIPSMVDTNPYEYTRTLNTADEEELLNRPMWVSVVDVERGLNQVRVVREESTF